MTPFQSGNNVPDVTLRDTIFFGELNCGCFSWRIFTPYFINLNRRYFARWALLSSKPISPSFIFHILRIVLWGAKKKMGRITARRIITCMANKHARRDLAVRQCPGNSVSTDRVCISIDPSFKQSISIFIKRTLPRPAFIVSVFLHPEPESFWHWHFKKLPSFSCRLTCLLLSSCFGFPGARSATNSAEHGCGFVDSISIHDEIDCTTACA